MISFIDKRTNDTKHAISVREEGEFIFIQYAENGKEYKYLSKNIQLLKNASSDLPFILYEPLRKCYKCGNPTGMLTYITFFNNEYEDVTFPWDKKRLLKYQNLNAHLQMPEIEFYGLKVLGDVDAYDKILMEKFPDRIKVIFSQTEGYAYPMNLCTHCGAKQGRFFLYKFVNEEIKKMNDIRKI